MDFFKRLFGFKTSKEKELLDKVSKLAAKDAYQEIVELINSLPKREQTPDLLSELGRAYNNLSWYLEEDVEDPLQYLHKAITIFKSIEKKQKDQGIWNYRIGYSYFFLNDIDKAKKHLSKADSVKVAELMEVIDYADTHNLPLEVAKLNFFHEKDLYDPNEVIVLEKYIEKTFGKITNIFHEVVSSNIHCDIYVIAPTKVRNYYTLVTGGMGAFDMKVPEGYRSPPNVELVINLPPDWDLESMQEKNYWPLRWLKLLARFPLERGTFLGWGDAVPTGTIEGNDFRGMLLISAEASDDDNGAKITLPSSKEVVFFYVVPLYDEEMLYKFENNAGELLDRFANAEIPYPPVVDLERENVCADFKATEDDTLLDEVSWTFSNKYYSELMPFYEDVKRHNDVLGVDLTEFTPFATMFKVKQIKVMYDALIKSKDDLRDFEILTDEKYLNVEPDENGYFKVKIVAIFDSLASVFPALETLFLFQNTLSNKKLEKLNFKGIEFIGKEEDGTPLMYLLLE